MPNITCRYTEKGEYISDYCEVNTNNGLHADNPFHPSILKPTLTRNCCGTYDISYTMKRDEPLDKVIESLVSSSAAQPTSTITIHLPNDQGYVKYSVLDRFDEFERRNHKRVRRITAEDEARTARFLASF